MVILIKLILFFLIIFVIYKLVSMALLVEKKMRNMQIKPEECPSCFERIRVDEKVMVCPSCGVKLGRNQKGELLIRIDEEESEDS